MRVVLGHAVFRRWRSDRQADQVVAFGGDDAGARELADLQRLATPSPAAAGARVPSISGASA